MAMDGMIAGVDTTGVAATFLLYNLATNPAKQELLHQEIVDIIGPSVLDPITESKLKKMKYLRACCQESHRMRPVTIGLGRRTQKEVTLSGYKVPQGVPVIYTAFVSYGSSSHYPDPQDYRPERWLRGHPDHHTAHPFAHIPFGHGPRMCIGRRFAELEVNILAIRLLQMFRLEYDDPKVNIALSFTNKPDRQVNIKFINRL